MAGSQGSFEDRIGKYKAGNTLIQGWADYAPTNTLITKAANNAFVAAVEAANTNVVAKKQISDDKKNDRKPLCFTDGTTNPDCAEQRIMRIASYLSSILPAGSKTVSSVNSILKKIRPNYPGTESFKSFKVNAGKSITLENIITNKIAKNTGTTPLEVSEPGSTNPPITLESKEEATIITETGNLLVKNLSEEKGGKIRLKIKTDKTVTNSPSEKTYASIDGFLTEVITLVNGIAAATPYSPPDPKITVAQLTALRNQIRVANADVTTAMDIYGTANRERKALYDSTNGMATRIRLIKSYLGSFMGGKKSEHYIEFSQAIKGT